MTTPAEIPYLQVEFKPGQYVKKGAFRSVFLAGLLPFCAQIKPKRFESGVDAIWLKPAWQDADGKSYDWTILDVESPGNGHSDIAANLDAGREFLRIICESGLEIGLIIFLSGKGLRFCWPYLIPTELQKAFRAWITDQAFPMVDPAPFTKKAFYRMFANRNHPNQGAVLGRHIHRLPNIHDLWFLAENDYLSLVTGTTDLKSSLAWLQEVIPTGFAPDPWAVFLNSYKIRAALAETIFRPIIPRRKFKKPISFLAEQAGIEFRQMQFAGGEYLSLRACPICGRRDGNPYVTEAGRLKCHHQNSCEAGAVDELGRIVGLPAEKWLPGEQTDEFEPIVTEDSDARISLDAARGALREAFKSKEDIYVTLSPGAGKSHTIIQEIMAAEPGKVAICTPEHRLNQEFFDLARGMARQPEKVHWLQGRNNSNCVRLEKVRAVARAGFSPGIIVCSSCPVKRSCTCDYYQQFENLTNADGTWFLTHSMALEVNLTKYHFDLLVVDENPLKIFLQKQESEHGAMLRIQSKMPPEGRAAMEKMLAVIPMQLESLERAGASQYDLSRIYASGGPVESIWEKQPSIWDVAGLLPDDRDRLDRALSVFQRFDDEKVTQWQKRLYYEEKIDLVALNWLLAALSGKPGVYARFQKDRTTPVKFITFRKRLPMHAGRVICLDATGNLPEVEALLGRQFKHVQGRVQMPGLRTAWVKQNGGKKLMSKMSDQQIGAMMKAAAAFLQDSDKKVLIVTHMAVEETVARLAAIALPGREIMTCHFWGGSRGVNEFGDCTAVIAMGTPFPNIDGLFDHAMALMSSPAERLAWIIATGVAELIQALHRVRPVKGDRTIIVVGRDFPTAEFGGSQFKLNRGRGDKAGETSLSEIIERLTPFVERWGFMTKEVAWCFKVFLESDKEKAMQAFEYIKDSIKEVEKLGYNLPDLLEKMRSDEKGTLPTGVYLIICLIGKRQLGAFLSLPYLTLPNHSTWHAVLKLLAERFALPEMTTLPGSSNGRQVYGVGYLSSMRKFFEAAHLPPFRNIEGVESPESE